MHVVRVTRVRSAVNTMVARALPVATVAARVAPRVTVIVRFVAMEIGLFVGMGVVRSVVTGIVRFVGRVTVRFVVMATGPCVGMGIGRSDAMASGPFVVTVTVRCVATAIAPCVGTGIVPSVVTGIPAASPARTVVRRATVVRVPGRPAGSIARTRGPRGRLRTVASAAPRSPRRSPPTICRARRATS